MSVGRGTPLVTISSHNIADGDPHNARIAYEVSKKEYERMKSLVKNKIVSDKDFAQAEQNHENARISYEALAKNHSAIGQNITAPIAGYVKSILVNEGDYVTIGQPLVSVTQNRRLFLRAVGSIGKILPVSPHNQFRHFLGHLIIMRSTN